MTELVKIEEPTFSKPELHECQDVLSCMACFEKEGGKLWIRIFEIHKFESIVVNRRVKFCPICGYSPKNNQ